MAMLASTSPNTLAWLTTSIQSLSTLRAIVTEKKTDPITDSFNKHLWRKSLKAQVFQVHLPLSLDFPRRDRSHVEVWVCPGHTAAEMPMKGEYNCGFALSWSLGCFKRDRFSGLEDRYSMVGRALALHLADLNLILSTSYGPWRLARSNSWAQS